MSFLPQKHLKCRNLDTEVTNIPRTRLKFDKRAFSVATRQAWNRLPTELKLMRSMPAFKLSLKTFFSRLPTVVLEHEMRHRSS